MDSMAMLPFVAVNAVLLVLIIIKLMFSGHKARKETKRAPEE